MNRLVFFDLLAESLRVHADRPCLHVKRNGAYQSWTYADLHRDLNRLTSVLKGLGLQRGATGVVIGENTPEWVISHLSIALTGACAVPIDPNLPAAEIEEIVRITQPRVVICSPVYASLFARIKTPDGSASRIFVMDPEHPDRGDGFAACVAGGSKDSDAFAADFAPEDPIAIIFTSGTTGKAKGAVLAQKNFTAAGLHGVPRMKVDFNDSMLAVLPLHHVFGFAACVAAALTAGISVVFVPVVKGPLILEALRDHHISILPAVPQMLELFYKNIQRGVREKSPVVRALFAVLKAVSSSLGTALGMGFRKKLFASVHRNFGGNLRMIISGGSSLKKAYFDGFRLMGFNIVEGYGLTETFGPITLDPIDDPRQASVGTVLPDNEMRIDRPNDEGIGEVCFRGATVFAGYYHNEEATREVFDADGWFHTGDLGRVSDDGFLYLTGRIKDIIVLNSGKNVYPDEVEEFYAVSPIIEEIGVIGVKHDGDETVAAVIVPAKDVRRRYPPQKTRELLDAEIQRLSQSLPTYKKIARFVVAGDPLPRTSTRKIRKPALRELYAALEAASGTRTQAAVSFLESSLMQTEEFVAITEFIRGMNPALKGQTLTPRTHLEFDAGFDSLKSLDLVCMIEERFKIVVPMEGLLKVETLGDAVNLARELRSAASTAPAPAAAAPVREAPGTSPEPTGGLVYRFLPGAVRSVSRLLWGLRISGTENIPAQGPLIFFANHESLIDSAWVVAGLPWPVRRRTFSTGKVELTHSPVLWFLLKRSHMIPVERQGDVREALEASRSVLRSGHNLVIFPEGTRTRTGEMGPFKAGIGTLMLETGAAAVPVKITGAFQTWPPGAPPRLPGIRSIRPTVSFGKVVTVADLVARGEFPANPNAEQIAAALQRVVAGMAP